MPDIGLFELILIGVLLFVVVGPERMPEFFSQIGRWVQSGRGWMRQFRQEITRETSDITTPIQQARSQVQQQLDEVSRTARDIGAGSHVPVDEQQAEDGQPDPAGQAESAQDQPGRGRTDG